MWFGDRIHEEDLSEEENFSRVSSLPCPEGVPVPVREVEHVS
jgi:hypothetical protein